MNEPAFLALPLQAVPLRLLPGQDLKRSLDQFVNLHHLEACCVLSCVGSLERAAIRFANAGTVSILDGKFEIVSLGGLISIAGSHLHIAISDNAGTVFGGHLKEGALIYTTAEIVLGVLAGVAFESEVDTTFGFKELFIKRTGDRISE